MKVALQIKIRKLPLVPWSKADVVRLLQLVAKAARPKKASVQVGS